MSAQRGDRDDANAPADEHLDEPLDEPEEAAFRDEDVDVVEVARRRHGALGTVIAAGMLGLEQALGRKPKEEIPVVVASNSDPEDIDRDGIVIPVDNERSVVSPPLPRSGESAVAGRHRGKRRRSNA